MRLIIHLCKFMTLFVGIGFILHTPYCVLFVYFYFFSYSHISRNYPYTSHSICCYLKYKCVCYIRFNERLMYIFIFFFTQNDWRVLFHVFVLYFCFFSHIDLYEHTSHYVYCCRVPSHLILFHTTHFLIQRFSNISFYYF